MLGEGHLGHDFAQISGGDWGVDPPRTWQQHRHDLWDRCGLSDRSSCRGGNPGEACTYQRIYTQ